MYRSPLYDDEMIVEAVDECVPYNACVEIGGDPRHVAGTGLFL